MLTWREGGDGELSSLYVIVEALRLADRRREEVTLLVCSCDDNKSAKNRLLTLRRQSRPVEQIVDFETAEKTRECAHAVLVRRLFPQVVRFRFNFCNFAPNVSQTRYMMVYGTVALVEETCRL